MPGSHFDTSSNNASALCVVCSCYSYYENRNLWIRLQFADNPGQSVVLQRMLHNDFERIGAIEKHSQTFKPHA